MQKRSGVYWLIHQATQRFYIGSTGDLDTRMSVHIRSLKGGYHFINELQNDYSLNANIVFEFFETSDKTKAMELEQLHIDQYFNSGRLYNASYNAKAPILGGCNLNRGEQWRDNQSVAKNDKKKPVLINSVEYESVKAAARALNISHALVSYRVRSESENFKDWQSCHW